MEDSVKHLCEVTNSILADLQAVKDSFASLRDRSDHNLQVFGQTTQDLRTRIEVLERQVQTQTSTPAMGIPKLPPFRFGGERERFRGFINQCKLFFAAHAPQFLTERSKVLTIIMLLSNKALAWANPLIETDDDCLNNLDAFISAMGKAFDDPNRGATAESAMLTLSQAKESLSRIIREPKPEPMQVDSLQRRVSDARKEQRLKENLCFYCGKSGHFIINCPSRSRKTTAAIIHCECCERGSVRSALQTPEGVEDTDIDYSDLNSVISEPDAGVTAAVFPVLSAVSQLSCKNNNSHCFIPLKLRVHSVWVSTSAMIDSGASGNFMDISFAQRHNVHSVKKATPVQMETVDGSLLNSGPVDQETEPLKVLMGNDHQESLSFMLISSPHFPIILGLPWLQAQNPTINWETKELHFPKTQISPEASVCSIPKGPPSVSELPAIYQEHHRHVKMVLERLRQNHLYIKLEKCEFHRTKIQFLGFLGVIHNQDLLNDIKEAYHTDPWLAQPSCEVSLVYKNGVWIQGQRLYIPEAARGKVLQLVHDSKIAGHRGVLKTQEFLSRFFWWPTYRRDVLDYVTSCEVCARCKTPRSSPTGLLQPLPIPTRPWGSISMDFIVELPTSQGKNTVLVVVDRLTKAAHFIPCVGLPTAKHTSDLIIQNVFRLHGVPDEVVSDRGVQFTSKFWQHFCAALNIKVNLSSAFHPQTNGQTERTNQTLEQYLRCFICHLQDDWVDLLPLAEFSYNNSQSASTKLSPFYANLGYHPNILPRFPIDTPLPAVADRITSLQQNLDLLRRNLESAQDRYKKSADRFRKPAPTFKVGDLVWLSTKNLKMRVPSSKLGHKYIGPYKITKLVSNVACRLQLPRSMRIHPVFHVSLLKTATPNSFPGRSSSPPAPVLIDGQEEFVVEKILDSRLRRDGVQYLVQWQGYSSEDNSWEPASNLHAPRLLRQFHQRYPGKPGLGPSGGCP
ncbi:uncharacterized protein [Dendrobates tinctorius]|uniref:uncharacterized protein n=1 Tax=Dendrobates tinctorius TaxID=92724 RepID=UPI003CC929F1